jgi:hypothetical protein
MKILSLKNITFKNSLYESIFSKQSLQIFTMWIVGNDDIPHSNVNPTSKLFQKSIDSWHYFFAEL